MKSKEVYFLRAYIEEAMVLLYIFMGVFLFNLISTDSILLPIWFLPLIFWISTRMGELLKLKYEKERKL